MNTFCKRFISLSLGITLAVSAGSAFAEDLQKMVILNIDSPNMVVNGQIKEIDPGKMTIPLIKDSRTLLPVRSIIEEMGGKIDWDSTSSKVSLSLNGKTVVLWIDKDTAVVNGEEKKLDTAAVIINERTMLPVRFISENLGLYINWDDDAKSIGISNYNDFILSFGGERVNSKEYTYFFTKEKYNYFKSHGGEVDKEFWTTPRENGQTPLDTVRTSAFALCRKYKLFLKFMKDSNYISSEKEQEAIKKSLDSLVIEAGSEESANEETMRLYGVSLADWQEIEKNNQMIEYFLEDFKDKLSLSLEEVQSFYENKKDSFEKYTVHYILLMTADNATYKPISQDKTEELKKQAEDILTKARAGEGFKELAQMYSTANISKDSGGEFTYQKGQMVKEFDEWSLKAKPGDVGIVESIYGYYVIKFIKKLEPEDMKYEILNAYYRQYQQELYYKWETEQQYQIVINKKEVDAIK